MIIKGKSRSNPGGLAAHLLNAETNERVEVIEVRGTIATDLRGALIEMDAYALGTQCEKPLYHANIDPQPGYQLTREQQLEAVDALEKRLGLEGHARAIVLHVKEGREHLHPVWSRIDTDRMRSVSDSHNYRKHEEVSRDLERRFGHERVQGAHHERDGVERPDRTPSRAELRQEERTGIKGKDVKLEVTAAFRSSDNAEAFKAALEDSGYLLARGNRRDFVVADRAGGIHSLGRRIDGMKAADLREFMKPLAHANLPTATQARDAQLDRAQGRTSSPDNLKWEDALAKSAIDKAKKQDKEDWRHRQEQRTSRKGALIEKSFMRGDYVSQTRAALKEHKRRNKKLDQPRPQHPGDRKKSEEEQLRRQAEESTKRQQAETEIAGSRTPQTTDKSGEMTDAKQARLNRLLNAVHEEERARDPDDPDRQREAPGGGRTRSR